MNLPKKVAKRIYRVFKPAQAPSWEMEVPALNQSHIAPGARLYATRVDALDDLPKGETVAEIGVAAGAFSEIILKKLAPSRFDAFDIFTLHEAEVATGVLTSELFAGKNHLDFYRGHFAKEISQGLMRVFVGDSVEQMSLQPDQSYGIIYIDGDHRYEGVKRDTEIAIRKLKPGGVLIFNDYVMNDCFYTDETFGTVPVVNDLCVNKGWKIVYFAMQRHMFCDIALRRF